MKKSNSTPDLTPAQCQRLQTGKSSNVDLQEAFARSQDFGSTGTSPRDGPAAEQEDSASVIDVPVAMKAKSDTRQSTSTTDKPQTVTNFPKVVEDKMSEVQKSSKSDQMLPTETSPKGKGLPQAALTQGPPRPASLDTSKTEKKAMGSGMGAGMDVVQGGISPSFLFLQLYHAHMFGPEERPLWLPQSEVRAIHMCNGDYLIATSNMRRCSDTTVRDRR